jgi:hypothetical protein
MKSEVLHKVLAKKGVRSSLFLILILSTSYFYNYHEIITYRPTSMHQWRNSVSASIAWNYAYEGEFLHPRTHNMQADNFTSDITITEFPLIYYIIGLLYRIFGTHEFIYRLINVVLGFTGLYFLFLLGLKAFRSTLYALVLPLIIFSSPIYVYYTNNFIPDATSLSIALIGFHFFYRFYLNGMNRDLVLSIFILCFAGLNKTPSLLLFFAIGGLFFIERFLKLTLNDEATIFKNRIQTIIWFSLAMLILLGWYGYAKIYTDIHGGVVSLVEIRPIWILSRETIAETWETMTKRFWAGRYHSPLLLIFAFILLIHNIVFWRRHNRVLNYLIVLTLLGGISFTLLFYRSMKQHDYYQMNNLIVPLLVMINFLLYLKNNHTSVFRSWITKSVFVVFIAYLVFSCRWVMTHHYYNGWFETDAIERYNSKYNDITPYLRSLGISRYDKVYCTPDVSINISLYLMDQKGFTDFDRVDLNFREKVRFFTEKGLQYVIIGDMNVIDVIPEELGMERIGTYNGVRIYKIR